MDSTLNELTRFATETTFDSLPEAVVDKATAILVDTLGCLVGGRNCRAVDAVLGLTSEAARSSEYGVAVGLPGRYPVELAAFLNTAMIRYLDFNDHLVAHHASDMIGALLAVVDRGGRAVSGQDLLCALVVAYEVHARVVATMRDNQTVDRTYSITIGATAGVCNLLRLGADASRHALAMATTSGVALRASRAGALSDYKGAASAVSMRCAVFHALIAEQGLTGPSAPFEGRHGLRELFRGEPGPVDLAPFDGWQLMRTCQKNWPVAYGIQPAIAAALGLRDEVDPARVDYVVLHAAPFAWHESGSEPERWNPTTRGSADHSLPYAFSHALRHGHLDARAFDETAFRDPDTLALMARVAVEPDWDRGPKISDIVGVRAELVTVDGTRHTTTVDEPPGHYLNPMTADDITVKVRALMAPVLGDRAEVAVAAAWDVRSAPDLRGMLAAFQPEYQGAQ